MTPPFAAAGLVVEALPAGRALELLAAQRDALAALADAALDPNPFLSPWFFLPALEAFAPPGLRVLLVRRPPTRQGPGPVVGLFPLVLRRGVRGLPFRCWGLWQHDYNYLGTPLVHREHGPAALDALFAWLRQASPGAGVLELPLLPVEGPFARVLIDALRRWDRAPTVVDSHTRALLEPAGLEAEAYLRRSLNSKRRTEFKRQEKKLAEQGAVEYRSLEPGADVAPWLEAFLALEAAGWKGRAGTAFAAQASHAGFLRALLTQGHAAGAVQMLGLFVAGRPVALKCNLRAGDGAVAFKIAYDESLARYSPGVLLELENLRRVCSPGGVRWMDSCAIPGHPMIDRLWQERRPMQTLLVPTGRWPGEWLLAVLPLLRWCRRLFKRRRDPLARPTRPPEATMLLQIDRETFARDFGRTAFALKHTLADHPLFGLPRLIELARTLPADRVEYNAGDLALNQDPGNTPRNGLSAEETIRRIEECRSWMVLKNVEIDPEYDALLRECLAEVAAQKHPASQGLCGREAFVFISSPSSVTPYHIDPELNFLLQIRGVKTMTVFPADDRDLLSEEELERFYAGAHRNLAYRDEYAARGRAFVMHPGDAVHVPVTAPHHVQNGPEVSISFSITFRTPATEHREIVYAVNHDLRRHGWKPTPVGRSWLTDTLKATGHRVLRRLRRLVGMKEPAGKGY